MQRGYGMTLKSLMMTGCLTLSVAGCVPATDAGLNFCDVEQPRLFTQAELTARKPFRRNLEADLVTNQTGEKHCGWKP